MGTLNKLKQEGAEITPSPGRHRPEQGLFPRSLYLYYEELDQVDRLSVNQEKKLFSQIRAARSEILAAAACLPTLALFIQKEAESQRETLKQRLDMGGQHALHAAMFLNVLDNYTTIINELPESTKRYDATLIADAAAHLYLPSHTTFSDIKDILKSVATTVWQANCQLRNTLVTIDLPSSKARRMVYHNGADIVFAPKQQADKSLLESARSLFRSQTRGINVSLAVIRDVTRRVHTYINKIDRYKQTLVLSNMRLSMAVANWYKTQHPTLYQDMIQEANIGLINAVERFDDTLEYKFSTYAVPWIQQAVRRVIVKSGAVKIPERLHYLLKKYNCARLELLNSGLNTNDTKLIAEKAHLSLNDIQQLNELPTTFYSLSDSFDETDVSVADTLIGDDNIDITEIEQELLRGVLRPYYALLTERERYVLFHSNELESYIKKKPSELSSDLNLSTNRIYMIRLAAIHKIKSAHLEGTLPPLPH